MKTLLRHIFGLGRCPFGGCLIWSCLLAGGFTAGCGPKPASDAVSSEQIVVEVGDSSLLLTDVVRRIPRGISPSDSAALFNSIVDGWVERLLLEDFGQENVEDMETIDRMVEEYRKKLIVASYRRSLRAAHRWQVPEDSVRRYYDLHRSELVLGRPVIKGLYVKIPTDAARLTDIRRWMMTATPDAIDNLEKYGLGDAVEYSFFEDRWTDWNVLSRQIPYRFGDPDEFVRTHRNFETSYGGMSYLLHISSSLPSGHEMPYDVASPMIAGILEGDAGENYEQRLIAGLYARARKEGRLKDHRAQLSADSRRSEAETSSAKTTR